MTSKIKNKRGTHIGDLRTRVMVYGDEQSTEYQVVWHSNAGTITSAWDYNKTRAFSIVKEDYVS